MAVHADGGDRAASRLAQAARSLLGHATTLGLSSSAATDHLLALLVTGASPGHQRTVVTSSLRHAELLAQTASRRQFTSTDKHSPRSGPPTLLLLGGELDPRRAAFYGSNTAVQLRRLRLDVAVVAAAALSVDGFSEAHRPSAEFGASLLNAARHRIVLIDTATVGLDGASHKVIAHNELTASDHILLNGPLSAAVLSVLPVRAGGPSVTVHRHAAACARALASHRSRPS